MNQFAAAFGGIQEARKEQPQVSNATATPIEKRETQHATPVHSQARSALAKSRNPAYEPVKLFMNTEKRRKAERKWEDEGGRDLSSLIETLLTGYLRT